jgi:hypothetical protein
MKAKVNPFTREVEITYNGEMLPIIFRQLDDWCRFNFGDKIFDAHFHYEDGFSFSVYAVDEYNGERYYQNNLINEIKFNF